MKEIELKILEINKKDVISKLKCLGAKKIFEGDVVGTAFKPFGASKKNLALIGVRKKGKYTFITLKGKKQKSIAKIQEELEFEIKDYEKAKKMFSLLGFNVLGETKKHRVSYKLSDVRFEIDSFKEIPTYLEIEGPSIKKIMHFVNLLGFSVKDTNNYNGKELFSYYGKKFGA
ncbi:MAG: class IV adenylate cyclase [Candidatus Nanoarchaeia archaeon]